MRECALSAIVMSIACLAWGAPQLPASMRGPVLFVHGYNASPESWGFEVGDEWVKPQLDNVETEATKFNEEPTDDLGLLRSTTAYEFARHFYPDFAEPGGIPNKAPQVNQIGIECFNMSNRHASGYEYEGPSNPGIIGSANELYQRIMQVLDEYDREDPWQSDQHDKVTLICHSQGGLLVKDLFMRYRLPSLANPMAHIDRVISIGTPYRGSPWGAQTSEKPSPWGVVDDVMRGYKDNAGSLLPVAIGQSIVVDPFESVRTQLEGMVDASVNFDPASPFILRVKDPANIATNPFDGTVVPWVYMICSDTKKLGQGLDGLRGFLTSWQDDEAWKKYVYTGGNYGLNVEDLLRGKLSCGGGDGITIDFITTLAL